MPMVVALSESSGRMRVTLPSPSVMLPVDLKMEGASSSEVAATLATAS